MTISDENGNMFNIEAVIAHETDPDELRLALIATYERLRRAEGVMR